MFWLVIFLIIISVFLSTRKNRYHKPVKHAYPTPKNSMTTFSRDIVDRAIHTSSDMLRNRIWIKYNDGVENNETERIVEIYVTTKKYFYAWCRLKNDARQFRFVRVKEWKVLNETFEWDRNIGAFLDIKKNCSLQGITFKKSYHEWLKEQPKVA